MRERDDSFARGGEARPFTGVVPEQCLTRLFTSDNRLLASTASGGSRNPSQRREVHVRASLAPTNRMVRCPTFAPCGEKRVRYAFSTKAHFPGGESSG